MGIEETTPSVTASRRFDHWAVRMNHRNRSICFAVLAPLIGLHLASQEPSATAWAMVIAVFLLYPQAAWWWARRAAQPLQAECWNMRLDAALFGAWTAALHFPAWIGFVLFTGGAQNLLLFRGIGGLAEAAAGWALGVALVGLLAGWQLQPDASAAVELLSALVLTLYLTISAVEARRRSLRLHQARQQLLDNERELKHQLHEIEALQARLREQALRDALTGLYNRHHLSDALGQALANCVRQGQPLSVLLIDVDHFKRINDTWGHPAGDAVLQQMAQRFQADTRGGDLLFRHGGEEFLIVLPQADAEAAFRKAEELRQRVGQAPFTSAELQLRCTVSIGTATLLDAADATKPVGPHAPLDAAKRAHALIASADAALYRAKAQGRDQTCQAERA